MNHSWSFLMLAFLGLTAAAQVDWREWGEAAHREAEERQVPLYLVIGDPLNENSVAMHRQTFGHARIAAFLNENFVCLYIDRDARPGLAAYGQQWLAAEQKIAGWPLNLWFTPDLLPIEAASYLPPTEEWGREGFMIVADRVAVNWSQGAEAVTRASGRRQERIADYLPFAADPVDDMQAALADAAGRWLAAGQPAHGVFGDPPHRPEPELLRFLMGQGGRSREVALAALHARLSAALRDPVDGGFHRATIDGLGSIPVFQKRLTDQARMALACLDANAISDDAIYAFGARGALDYVIDELGRPDGTFRVGDDATAPEISVHQSWTWTELRELVGADHAAALGATPHGNVDAQEDFEGLFTGRNLLHASPTACNDPGLATARQTLRTARTRRGAVAVAKTATAGAHGLMLHVLDRAAIELAEPRYRQHAAATQTALRRNFAAGSGRMIRQVQSAVPATPEDLILVALGLNLDSLAVIADENFYEADFGFYYATTEEVLGIVPQMGPTGRGDLPGPGIWRLLIDDPPRGLAAEIAAPLGDQDQPPPGEVLWALQRFHAHP